jgi:hypothetical protein
LDSLHPKAVFYSHGMTNLEIKKISAGWLALVVPVIGAGIFYLWQPITYYFVTEAFDENVVLLIDAEIVKSDTMNSLLAIDVKAYNRSIFLKLN